MPPHGSTSSLSVPPVRSWSFHARHQTRISATSHDPRLHEALHFAGHPIDDMGSRNEQHVDDLPGELEALRGRPARAAAEVQNCSYPPAFHAIEISWRWKHFMALMDLVKEP